MFIKSTPDGSLFFLRAVRGEDDGTYWCVAVATYPNNNNNYKGSTNTRSQNATLRVACKSTKKCDLCSISSTVIARNCPSIEKDSERGYSIGRERERERERER